MVDLEKLQLENPTTGNYRPKTAVESLRIKVPASTTRRPPIVCDCGNAGRQLVIPKVGAVNRIICRECGRTHAAAWIADNWDQYRKAIGVPDEFADAEPDQVPGAIRLVESLTPGQGIGVFGKVGVGKTHRLVAGIRYVSTTGKVFKIVWADMLEFVARYEAQKREWGRSPDGAVAELLDHKLIVLDDVGAGESKTERDLFRRIVRSVWNDAKSTLWFTSHMSEKDFAAKVGRDVYDRIRDKCVLKTVEETKSRRGNQG